MAPSSIFSRLSNSVKGNAAPADPNSRHARMASVSSGPPSSTYSKTSFENGPSSPAREAPRAPPRLVLTTDSSQGDGDHRSIHAPATPNDQRPPSVLLDDTEDVTMSPEEARSSEEAHRRLNGRRGSPAGLDLTSQKLMSQGGDSDATPTTNGTGFPQNIDTTPRPTQGTLGYMEGNGNGTNRSVSGTSTVDRSLGKKLAKAPSSTSINIVPQHAKNGSTTSAPPENTLTRTTTQQLLSLPSDGEGGISDTASIISTGGTKKRLWKKKSTSSFMGGGKSGGGGGIGAALAASGMGLAQSTGAMPVSKNASISPERLRQETMKIAQVSPPKTAEANRSQFRPRRGSRESDMDSEGAYDSDEHDALSFNDQDIPITGFAVASSKRNADFHEVFPEIPDDDYLIEDYGCALQKEILVQGRLYISENHMAFHANIFGWVTNFTVPFTSVTGLEKRMTAFVIPNAIQIATTDQKYMFASFLSRDTTFDVISNIWRLARPGVGDASFSDIGSSSNLDVSAITAASNGDGKPAAGGGGGLLSPKDGKKAEPHRATTCNCSRNNGHYPTTTMDAVLPGTPEKIYNLMLTSGFIKDFMANDQKLMSIQISDWAPQAAGSHLLARNMSYIKPLNGSVGPKQTKCEIRDETIHVDFDEWATTLTTTRTPDVPSGGSFAIKTRTCFTWAGPATTRVVVSTVVEWTGRSFLKSIIDRSAMDGQRTYATDLEKAMRQYINDHRTEFLPEGVDAVDAVEALTPDAVTPAVEGETILEVPPERRVDVERRGMQWALDTINSALKLTSLSFWGLVDILGDLWEMGPDMPESSSGRMWWGIVIALVVMNFWTWSSLNQSREREKLTKKTFARMGGAPGYPPYAAYGGVPQQGGNEQPDKDKLAVVATEAVRVFWEGVVERQDQKWRREIEAEMKALREALQRLEQSQKPILRAPSLADVD